jgi:hypothetical protein
MSTSVKISVEAKKLLDKLQAKVVLSIGRKPSQEEVLDAILRLSTERQDEIITRLAGVKLPLSARETEQLMAVPEDWGVRTKEEDIDEILYGPKRKSRT